MVSLKAIFAIVINSRTLTSGDEQNQQRHSHVRLGGRHLNSWVSSRIFSVFYEFFVILTALLYRSERFFAYSLAFGYQFCGSM